MWSKTLTGRHLSMQSTPLGPWEVGASAGPAGAGLLGHTDASQILITSDVIRKGKALIVTRDRITTLSQRSLDASRLSGAAWASPAARIAQP